jgi:hypothetical protein
MQVGAPCSEPALQACGHQTAVRSDPVGGSTFNTFWNIAAQSDHVIGSLGERSPALSRTPSLREELVEVVLHSISPGIFITHELVIIGCGHPMQF